MIRLLALTALICAGSLSASTITVANLNDAGTDSLRDAVTNATTGDDIVFDASLAGGTLTLTTGQINAGSKNLTITGLTDASGKPEITINGNDTSRILRATGDISLTNLRFLDGNSGGNDGGAISHGGGNLLICRNCVFESNRTTGGHGGAISGGFALLVDCSFVGNSTPSNRDGGAVWTIGGPPTGTIQRCTFSGNSSGVGGAIYAARAGALTISITNSTFSGNQAASGGGIAASSSNSTTLINATHCTFSENTSSSASGGQCVVLVAVNSGGAAISLFNAGSSVFTDSSADAMFALSVGGGTERFTSADYNVCSDAPAWLNEPSDHTTTDPMLSALADNGGLTLTHAIGTASPAMNAGSPVGLYVTDQRAYTRDANPDSGAYEFIVSAQLEVTYNSTVQTNSATNALTPDVEEGTGVPVTVNLANIASAGAGDLTVTLPLTVSGLTNCTASVTTAPTATIAAGANSDLILTITPSAPGAYSATLTITNSDNANSPFVLTFTGTATVSTGSGGGGSGGGDDDESCSTGTNNGFIWLALLVLIGATALRPRRA